MASEFFAGYSQMLWLPGDRAEPFRYATHFDPQKFGNLTFPIREYVCNILICAPQLRFDRIVFDLTCYCKVERRQTDDETISRNHRSIVHRHFASL
jgi:hypothetical protein